MNFKKISAWKITIALFCILFAVFGLLETFGVMPPVESVVGEISFIRMICALFLLALIFKYLISLKVCKLIFCLSLLFMTLETNISYLCGAATPNLIDNWTLLFYTILICIGLSLLLPGRKKNWRSGRGSHRKEIHVEYDGHNYHDNNIGSHTIYVDCDTFTDRYIENNLGSTVIRFENTDAYSGGGTLHIENNLGSTVVDLPAGWVVDCQMDNHLGSLQNRVQNESGPMLTIAGENNLGSVVIREA